MSMIPASPARPPKRARTTASNDVVDGAKEAGVGLEVTVPRSVPHCYNNNYTVRLTYADTFRHELNYSTAATQIFRTNSIYDPDYTNTGHQPLMRDLWASQYDYYTVLACDYEIHLYNGAVDSLTWTSSGTYSNRIGCCQATLLPTTNISDYLGTTVFPIAEMKNSVTKFLVPEKTIQFNGTLTPGDFIVDAKDSDSDATWTAVGSNPAVGRYIGYQITSSQQAAITGQNKTPVIAVTGYVKLNYTVQFTQLSQALRSYPS